ncbi:MAG: DNA methyltransferase [Caldisphaera sp.]
MQKFEDKLITLLKKLPKFVDERTGNILRNEVVNSALKIDKELISLLISDKEVKEKFFGEVNGYWVFETNRFIDYIQNKEFLNDTYTKFKNKIGLTIDNKFIEQRGEVALSFPFKDCILEGGMTKDDEQRNEIFFNKILAQDQIDRLLDPKVLTNFKRFSAKGDAERVTEFKRDKKGTIRDNLVIKGNNLLTLYSLREQFQDKVKLIYIDPPYNTEGASNTFAYNNNFNHSSWLTFMKNRLEVAKDLLKEDGVVVITIDDYEYAHLKLLCDETYDRENYIGTIVVQSNPRGRTTNTYFATCHEYALFYAKDIENVSINFIDLTEQQKLDFDEKDKEGEYRLLPFRRSGGTSTPDERPNSYYPIYYNEQKGSFSLEKQNGFVEILPIDKLGKKRVWRQTRPSFLEAVKRGDMICKKSKNRYILYMKDRIKEGRKPKTIWVDSKYDASANGTMLLKNIFGGEKLFSYPKSLFAVKDTIDIITERGGDDIILDFFAGSGTTAHAVLELNKEDKGNRQFILCEQMNYIGDVTVERIRKIMGKETDFIYCELMKYNQDALEKLDDAKDTKQLLSIWKDLCEKYFLDYNLEIKKFNDNLDEFNELSISNQRRILTEMLNKNQLYVNLSEIDDAQFKVSEEDKELNKKFYGD